MQGSRRMALVRGCVHLSRELVSLTLPLEAHAIRLPVCRLKQNTKCLWREALRCCRLAGHFRSIKLTRRAAEQVLQDGLSRMSKEELAGTLSFLVSELKDSDDAIRLGGSKGIRVGADHRDELHNQIMYNSGCPWRSPETLGIQMDQVRRRGPSDSGATREGVAVGEATVAECEHPVIGQVSCLGLCSTVWLFLRLLSFRAYARSAGMDPGP